MCQPAPESMLYRNMCIDGKVWAVQEAGSQCLNYADAQLTRVWIGPYSEDCNCIMPDGRWRQTDECTGTR